MSRQLILCACLVAALGLYVGTPNVIFAAEPPPHAPASVSWIPHGYGGCMWVHNTVCSRKKGLWGFRTAPRHIGCWSQPLWGWDVNGYYCGPNEPCIDPADQQLPIGLIYPEKSPPLPPPPPKQVTKIRSPEGAPRVQMQPVRR